MFEDRLRELEGQHLLRRLRLVESEPGPVATIEGRPVIVMASNNYLGLATHPLLKQAAIAATARFGQALVPDSHDPCHCHGASVFVATARHGRAVRAE